MNASRSKDGNCSLGCIVIASAACGAGVTPSPRLPTWQTTQFSSTEAWLCEAVAVSDKKTAAIRPSLKIMWTMCFTGRIVLRNNEVSKRWVEGHEVIIVLDSYRLMCEMAFV